MADAMTTTASLSFDQTMWDRAIYYALRPELYFDMFADVGVTDAAPDKGATVTFTKFTEMAAATTPLSETVDIDAVALADSQTSLTLAEYGNGVNSTFRVRATSFIELNRPVANLIGFNAGISLDTLARDIMAAGTNVRYPQATQARVNVAATNVLTAAHVRRSLAELRTANVATFNGYYAGVIHPYVSYDLRGETGAAAWRDPHTYSAPENIWNGEIGAFEGIRFLEASRAPYFADSSNGAGAGGNVDVFRTMIFGRQAMAKAYSTYEGRGALPIVIMGPVVDKLKRFQPVSWHWFGKFGMFRQEALYAWETAATISNNTGAGI